MPTCSTIKQGGTPKKNTSSTSNKTKSKSKKTKKEYSKTSIIPVNLRRIGL